MSAPMQHILKQFVSVRLIGDLTAHGISKNGSVFRKGGYHFSKPGMASVDDGFFAFLTLFAHGGGILITGFSVTTGTPDFFTERTGIFRIGQHLVKVTVVYCDLHAGQLIEGFYERKKLLGIDLNAHFYTAF